MNFPVSEAARLVGRDRKTLYRDIKSGRLSATVSSEGEKRIDVSELVRVYGELRDSKDSLVYAGMPQVETVQATAEMNELRVRLAAAEAELNQMRARLTEKDAHISDLRGTVRLLAAPKPVEADPWWKFW